MLTRDRLQNLLDTFPGLTIALVGDLFLDRYLEIDPGDREISIETGLEAYQVARVRNSPGALGTVMNNLAALGIGCLKPVTVLGDDGHAYDLLQQLSGLPVDQAHLVQDANRLTPTYTKPLKLDQTGIANELNRLDIRPREPMSSETSRRLCRELRSVFEASDGLIVLDQVVEPNWGVVNQHVRDVVCELADREPKKLVFVDSRAHLDLFSRGILKGNRSELLAAAGAANDSSPRDAARLLALRTDDPVFGTIGDEGILIAQPAGDTELADAVTVDGPIDIVGAGDSATSGIVAALLSGAKLLEAAQVGNLVAAVTIQQLGTTGTATPSQVLGQWDGVHRQSTRPAT